ncbi:MAG TPA: proton-conducting transporter membrane subunit, partial [Vicinamibacterales bacterium]|nr:proton-conducting transporter membrane subunit [Vicinamibacterales bacterium]
IGAGFSAAGFFHLLTHGLFKALLFLGAGAVIHAVHSNDLPRMGGLARRMPQTAIVFLIGTLSLAGIPFFGGFLSKEEILGAVWAGGLRVPFVALIFVAFLTAFYMFRVVFLAFFGPPRAGHDDRHDQTGHSGAHEHDPPASMLVPLWILALLSMAVGVYFTFVHGEPEFSSPGWLTPVAIGAAVGGIALALLTYQLGTIDPASLASLAGPIRRAALAKFWIDDLFEGVFGAATLGFSRLVGWIDRYLVDGVLNVVSAWTVTTGDEMRTIQTGRAQDYVYGLGVGLLVLLLWVRWALV